MEALVEECFLEVLDFLLLLVPGWVEELFLVVDALVHLAPVVYWLDRAEHELEDWKVLLDVGQLQFGVLLGAD